MKINSYYRHNIIDKDQMRREIVLRPKPAGGRMSPPVTEK
jgi:hypothetical protein